MNIPKILIVDDSATDVVLLHYLLKKVGYADFLTARSADDAFRILKMDDPSHLSEIDLIFMDVEMPGISGIEACRQIKLTKHVRDIPIIMITARNDQSSFKLAFSAGALDYMQKPVKEPELLARVHSALRLKEETDMRRKRENELVETNRMLSAEREKSEKLLLNILPEKIVRDLKTTGHTQPELFENVTVFISDLVRFTALSAMLDPESLIQELNEMFTAFDDIMEANQCERIKTIGDAYMAVCGMPESNPDHAVNMAKAALEVIEYLKIRNQETLIKWQLRIGIHSGKVVGGVVGVKKYMYDIFGDTVNTASRLEALSDPMKINISEYTFRLIQDGFFCTERPKIQVKGKGILQMYFLDGRK
ncbi:MAG: adenylate/guanylate cyclase domain-containing protein [Desulfobacterales bacterium]